MTRAEIESIVADIVYKDWTFYIGEKDETLYLQVQFDVRDSLTKELMSHRGRKWLLSEFMVKSEVVQTAFLAALTAEEHECREHFTYKGERIFSPHFDVEALRELSEAKRFETRG
jgi:hypothetical protein